MDYPAYRKSYSDDDPAIERKYPKAKRMSSWLQRQASSHQAQIAGTAVLSGLAVACTIFGVQAIRRKVAIEDLKASIPNVDEDHHAQT